MLEHDGRARLVQTPTTTGLQPAFGAAATDTDSWATTDNNLLYNTIGTQPMKADEQWVFDNGAIQHLVGDKRYFVSFRDLTQEEREEATVYGYNGESSPVGIGSIDLWVSVDGLPVVLRIDNVYYSPEKTNLFSQSVATEQGFQIGYSDSTREYTLSMNGEVAMQIKVHPCKL
ncbi:Transposon-encoded protein [Phytophthora cinnamomi]|uniref:Transposon-encoded protein n=1 Tax=Phytophthora cinnamomi TaxID=4785 RepID=UPI003559A046|nr:Transposon-encoded protein [Phytophthora cinnamomi]